MREIEEAKSKGSKLITRKVSRSVNAGLQEISKEKVGEAYARNTSRKTVNDNYNAHQQRVRRAKRKRSWQLEAKRKPQGCRKKIEMRRKIG